MHSDDNMALPAERFYIDCEFDGHGGQLISLAIVAQDGRSAHITVTDYTEVRDPWVSENVVAKLRSLPSERNIDLPLLAVGPLLRLFIGDCPQPVIIADSPVDIGRFCEAISTGSDGGWKSTEYPMMVFEVHNVDCYPTTLEGAVQHNAWWDAMALRHKLAKAIEARSDKTCKGLAVGESAVAESHLPETRKEPSNG